VTRRQIESQLDGLRRRVPDRWWLPYAVLAGALVTGFVVSRVPMLKLIATGARAVNAGMLVASTVASVDRFISERPSRPKAA
jgi:hypothetical protein